MERIQSLKGRYIFKKNNNLLPMTIDNEKIKVEENFLDIFFSFVLLTVRRSRVSRLIKFRLKAAEAT